MKPALFGYFAPSSVDEVVSLLQEYGADGRLLAGGQSLVPALNFRLSRPAAIIDLNRVPDLAYSRERDGRISIGAMTRQRTIENAALIADRLPLLREATRLIGHLPIRSRGTIGGSLANADPAAEYPAVIAALDGVLVLRSHRGERRVKAADFFLGALTTAAEPDEFLCEISLPTMQAGGGWAFEEISRRHGDFALAGVAAQITRGEGGALEARLAACGVGPGPVRLAEAEAIIERDGAGEAAIAAAADAAAAAVSPHTDQHGSADYRRKLTGVMAARALRRASDRAGVGVQ